jgi:hypothetical protein
MPILAMAMTTVLTASRPPDYRSASEYNGSVPDLAPGYSTVPLRDEATLHYLYGTGRFYVQKSDGISVTLTDQQHDASNIQYDGLQPVNGVVQADNWDGVEAVSVHVSLISSFPDSSVSKPSISARWALRGPLWGKCNWSRSPSCLGHQSNPLVEKSRFRYHPASSTSLLAGNTSYFSRQGVSRRRQFLTPSHAQVHLRRRFRLFVGMQVLHQSIRDEISVAEQE